jgi:hypothetical protein
MGCPENGPSRKWIADDRFGDGRSGERRVNIRIMTRRPILTNDAARHPFRRSLPPPAPFVAVPDDDQDWRLFLLSFAAFFICFYTMIA